MKTSMLLNNHFSEFQIVVLKEFLNLLIVTCMKILYVQSTKDFILPQNSVLLYITKHCVETLAKRFFSHQRTSLICAQLSFMNF